MTLPVAVAVMLQRFGCDAKERGVIGDGVVRRWHQQQLIEVVCRCPRALRRRVFPVMLVMESPSDESTVTV
jgi:hypothetical protein